MARIYATSFAVGLIWWKSCLCMSASNSGSHCFSNLADVGGSSPHNRADLFSQNDPADIPARVQVEDEDRQGILAAEADGGGVHHAQPHLQHVGDTDRLEHLRVAVPGRVAVVDALDLGGLHDDLGVDLHGAQ